MVRLIFTPRMKSSSAPCSTIPRFAAAPWKFGVRLMFSATYRAGHPMNVLTDEADRVLGSTLAVPTARVSTRSPDSVLVRAQLAVGLALFPYRTLEAVVFDRSVAGLE